MREVFASLVFASIREYSGDCDHGSRIADRREYQITIRVIADRREYQKSLFATPLVIAILKISPWKKYLRDILRYVECYFF